MTLDNARVMLLSQARTFAAGPQDTEAIAAMCRTAQEYADALRLARAATTARDTGEYIFPPYGRSKGLPVKGASVADLEFYKNGCLRTLADPGKARFHGKEQALLNAIEAELAGR